LYFSKKEKKNSTVCKEKPDSYFHKVKKQLIFPVNKKRSFIIYNFVWLWPLEDKTSNKTECLQA